MTRRKTLKAREPNGRVQRETGPSAAEVRRLRDASLSGMRDSRWGTELGRLFLAQKITSEQFAAGERWATIAARYAQAIQAPSANPRSIQIGQGSAGAPVDVDTDEGSAEARRHRKAVRAYLDALGLLSVEETRAMVGVVQSNEAITSHMHLLDLQGGLSTLASHWRLTAGSKSPSDR